MSRFGCLALVLAGASLWWQWPKLAPALPLRGRSSAIVVLADDPRRTETALNLWQRQQQQQQLWILGSVPLQLASMEQLRRRSIDLDSPELVAMLEGDDTVGQLTALSGRLPQAIGRVTLVTDQAHRARALAIARHALGAQGIQVTSPPAEQLPPVPLPEDPRRRDRDQLRVQLWRATGWDGRELGLSLGLSSH